MKKLILPLLLLFLSLHSIAQFTIKGRVVNKTDKEPIPSAVVFINNSAIAATTDSAGHFKLTVPIGQYRLLINIVGYENYSTPIILKGNTVLNDIELIPKIEAIKEVTVKAKATTSPCFPIFVQEFFGNSMFARSCKILNPLVLQFYDITPKGGFSARSSDFIQIENDALGYKVKFYLLYFIKDADKQRCYFNGQSFFEEMHGTPKQEREWRKNRLECYEGSTMQLLRAVMSDSLAENGFRIKRASRKLNPYFNRNGLVADAYDINSASALAEMASDLGIDDYSDNTHYNDKMQGDFLKGKDILLGTNQKGLYAISGISPKDTSLNSFYIEHTKDAIPFNGAPVYVPWIWGGKVSFFTFNKPDKPYLVFNTDGKMLNPGVVDIDGFMLGQTRVATFLPFDYRPVQ
jgi:hypothetical protein